MPRLTSLQVARLMEDARQQLRDKFVATLTVPLKSALDGFRQHKAISLMDVEADLQQFLLIAGMLAFASLQTAPAA